MKPLLLCALTAIAAISAGAASKEEDLCDFSLNAEAPDGHTPADPSRYFTVCASSGFEAHPSTVMLPDDKTIFAFWDTRQAGPCGSAAVSGDAGRTWTRIDDRLPKEFSQCHDEPKAWRFVDPKSGKGRIRVFASYGTASKYDWRGADGRPLAEAMPSIVSEDDGATWKYVPPLGADFACVVGFSGMVRLNDGAYLGVYSSGRNPNGDGGDYRVMGSFSRDGGQSWEKPFALAEKAGCRFLLPTVFRSPDGKELCCIASNWGCPEAWASYSTDEGRTWSEPTQAIGDLAGAEHSVKALPGGRLVIAFRQGSDLRAWTGDYRSLRNRKNGEGFLARLYHNYGDAGMAGSPSVHARKNGEIVVVAHSRFDSRRPMPAIVAMRFMADEIERNVLGRRDAKVNFENWNPFAGTAFRPLVQARLYGPFAQEIVMKDKKKRTIIPFDGKKAYIAKVGGGSPQFVSSKNGAYDIAKHANRRRGNAAILVWTVRVPEDCKARFRVIGAPSAQWCVGTKVALPAVCTDIYGWRTVEVALKQGDNDISVMVYQPLDSVSKRNGFSDKPMRVAAALELKDFECVGSQGKLDIKDAGEMSIDDEPEL